MTFQDILARLRHAVCEKVPAPEMASLQKASLMLRKSGILDRCLQTGETAPDFVIPVAGMDPFPRLYSLLESGPVVLNFYRGTWCDFCRMELQAFADMQKQFEKAGATCLALSPQHPQSRPEDLGIQSYPEGILAHDHDNQIAHAFGIAYPVSPEYQKLFLDKGLNLSKLHQTEHWELPLAATYLIAQDHTVRFSYVETDFRKRFDPQLILEQL